MKTKHFLLCCLTVLCSINTYADEITGRYFCDFTVDGLHYDKLGGDSVEVTYYYVTSYGYYPDSYSEIYNDASGAIVIPSTVSYNDKIYRVTAIGGCAFYNCRKLTSVTIPNSVTSIDGQAFYNCSKLTSVTIPNNVTRIYSEAFYGCSSLTTIDIPNSVTTIGYSAFSGCSRLTTITIPNSVTSIGNDAFSGCSSLQYNAYDNNKYLGNSENKYHALISVTNSTSCTIHENTKVIASGAFNDCYSLTTITISKNITKIPSLTFSDCRRLSSVVWNAKQCEDFGRYSYYDTPFYYNNVNNSSANFDLRAQITSFTFGDSVEHIPAYLCDGMVNLRSITIPDEVVTIGKYAFRGCSGLTSITIPNSVISIGNHAFSGCIGLIPPIYNDNLFAYMPPSYKGSYSIPDGIKSIGNSAFSDCTGLTSITIPESVTSIGSYAFKGCTSLNSVTIPNGATSIGAYAFSGCANLTSIAIPNSVTKIDAYAFYHCTGLKSISIGNSVISIGESAFEECTSLTSIIIPDNVKNIGDEIFSKCTSLTSATIGDSVAKIGSSAFYGCSSLTSITIGNSVQSIGSNAFTNCRALTSIVIPDCVTSIDSEAFYFCSRLDSITIGNGVTHIGGEAFWACGLTYVEIGSSVTNIGYQAFRGCSSLTTIVWNAKSYGDFSGTTPFHYWPPSNESIMGGDGSVDLRRPITSFIFGDSVQHIPAYLCSGMKNLTSIQIGQNVKSIGKYAFADCPKLDSIIISNNVKSIGKFALKNCTGLTAVTIGNSVTSIGNCTFIGCDSLSSVVWCPKTYSDCPSTQTPFYCYRYYDNNTDKTYSFDLRKQITSFTFGDSVQYIPACLCSEMTKLTSITLPKSVTNIGDFAFNDCAEIDSISSWAITPPVINLSYTFNNVSRSTTVCVPKPSLNLYKTANVWKEFYNYGYTENLTLNKTSVSLYPQETELLIVSIPTDATNHNIIWSSSDTNVAKVSDDGLITAVGTGTATITAKTEDDLYTATCVITVLKAVEGVSIQQTDISLIVGETVQLQATIEPADASNLNVIWSSSNSSVVSINSNGLVTAIGNGTAIITITTEDGGYTAMCEVTVTTPVSGILLDITSLELFVGASQQLTATIQPEDATNKNVIWTSGDNSIASVELGLVTAFAKGTTIIIAKTEDGNHTAECEVVVTDNTAVENISADNVSGVHKVLENGTIYILRNNEKYTIDGRKIN